MLDASKPLWLAEIYITSGRGEVTLGVEGLGQTRDASIDHAKTLIDTLVSNR